MNILQTAVSRLIWTGTSISCRIDAPDLQRVPHKGPMILAVNHINSLEVPLLVAHLAPRRMIGLAKIETWNSRLMGMLFDLYEAIPIRRGEADLLAIHRCLEVLAARQVLVVAPEGTRSLDGKLRQGRPGIALLALHSESPILPVAHWGGEAFPWNIKHLKRTDFHIRVGKPFKLDSKETNPKGSIRQAMTDEIMFQIAALMPEEYRGRYALSGTPPQEFIRFI